MCARTLSSFVRTAGPSVKSASLMGMIVLELVSPILSTPPISPCWLRGTGGSRKQRAPKRQGQRQKRTFPHLTANCCVLLDSTKLITATAGSAPAVLCVLFPGSLLLLCIQPSASILIFFNTLCSLRCPSPSAWSAEKLKHLCPSKPKA